MIVASELNISSKHRTSLNFTVDGGNKMTLQSATPVSGSSDYNRLKNLPRLNGEQISGNKTSIDYHIVSENTTDGWGKNPTYVPKPGEIIIYTDYGNYVDKTGETVVYPSIKIGDGKVPVIDLPFVTDGIKNEIMNVLDDHINNTSIHVSEEDRMRWDAKLNYVTFGETLILTQD